MNWEIIFDGKKLKYSLSQHIFSPSKSFFIYIQTTQMVPLVISVALFVRIQKDKYIFKRRHQNYSNSGFSNNFNSSCPRNLKHFGNPKKWKFAQKSQILWGKWISGQNVHKSADYWDTQFFLFSQKFHDQFFFPNCEKTEPIDSKNGMIFENPQFNSCLTLD